MQHSMNYIGLMVMGQFCGLTISFDLTNISYYILYKVIPQREPYQSLKCLVWPVWSTWPYQTLWCCSETMAMTLLEGNKLAINGFLVFYDVECWGINGKPYLWVVWRGRSDSMVLGTNLVWSALPDQSLVRFPIILASLSRSSYSVSLICDELNFFSFSRHDGSHMKFLSWYLV